MNSNSAPPAYTEQEFDRKVSNAIEASLVTPQPGSEPWDTWDASALYNPHSRTESTSLHASQVTSSVPHSDGSGSAASGSSGTRPLHVAKKPASKYDKPKPSWYAEAGLGSANNAAQSTAGSSSSSQALRPTVNAAPQQHSSNVQPPIQHIIPEDDDEDMSLPPPPFAAMEGLDGQPLQQVITMTYHGNDSQPPSPLASPVASHATLQSGSMTSYTDSSGSSYSHSQTQPHGTSQSTVQHHEGAGRQQWPPGGSVQPQHAQFHSQSNSQSHSQYSNENQQVAYSIAPFQSQQEQHHPHTGAPPLQRQPSPWRDSSAQPQAHQHAYQEPRPPHHTNQPPNPQSYHDAHHPQLQPRAQPHQYVAPHHQPQHSTAPQTYQRPLPTQPQPQWQAQTPAQTQVPNWPAQTSQFMPSQQTQYQGSYLQPQSQAQSASLTPAQARRVSESFVPVPYGQERRNHSPNPAQSQRPVSMQPMGKPPSPPVAPHMNFNTSLAYGKRKSSFGMTNAGGASPSSTPVKVDASAFYNSSVSSHLKKNFEPPKPRPTNSYTPNQMPNQVTGSLGYANSPAPSSYGMTGIPPQGQWLQPLSPRPTHPTQVINAMNQYSQYPSSPDQPTGFGMNQPAWGPPAQYNSYGGY